MNKKNIIEILKKYQPMPKDSELTQEIIDEYASVIDYVKENPDDEFIEYLMNSFGEFDGAGLYQEAVEILSAYPKERVLPILKKQLQSLHDGILYWSTVLSLDFPDDSLLPLLKMNVQKNITKEFAMFAIKEIGTKESLEFLIQQYNLEKDKSWKKELGELIESDFE